MGKEQIGIMVLNDFKDLKDFNDTKDFRIRCLHSVPSFSKGGAGVVCIINRTHLKILLRCSIICIKNIQPPAGGFATCRFLQSEMPSFAV